MSDTLETLVQVLEGDGGVFAVIFWASTDVFQSGEFHGRIVIQCVLN